MSIHQLLEKNNPILSIPLSGISEDADREQIKNDLIETMKNFNGIGLSANQIGIMENLTHDDFMTILERYAKLQGFEVNYVMVDPELEAREAYLESLA